MDEGGCADDLVHDPLTDGGVALGAGDDLSQYSVYVFTGPRGGAGEGQGEKGEVKV